MSARARACIDLAALRANLRVVRRHAPAARVCVAVKADGYGHGAAPVAAALADADAFAVSDMREAQALRDAGERRPLMLLSDPLAGETLRWCRQQNCEPVLFHPNQIATLEAQAPAGLRVWVKLDTGMHRLGLPADDARACYQRLRRIEGLEIAGWLTHLACADTQAHAATEQQIRCFHAAIEGLPGARSIANSAGVCAWPAAHADRVRPGIMLYGGSPLAGTTAAALGLQPAMTLSAPLLSVARVAAGESVGYGATWQAPETLPVGVLAIGYGDGYPRHVPSGTPVIINGVRVPLIGRVSMDLITVDLRGCPAAAVGDNAILWGRGLPADEVAAAAGTIAYELFCRLTQRVTYDYI